MPKYLKTGLVLSGLILLGAGCAKYSKEPASTPAPGEVVATAPSTPGQMEAVIDYRDGMFDPETLRVLPGTKVTFVNKGTKGVWPASAVHPTHQLCPGFDALKTLQAGETYSFQFTAVKDCPFHNHVAPSEKGKIEVKSAE